MIPTPPKAGTEVSQGQGLLGTEPAQLLSEQLLGALPQSNKVKGQGRPRHKAHTQSIYLESQNQTKLNIIQETNIAGRN